MRLGWDRSGCMCIGGTQKGEQVCAPGWLGTKGEVDRVGS